ncbi:MAG: pyruvate kinase [Erysipelotrichaceae bacterium]|nr:pyruvate kinase [Erysipelotrichaceae bacterium]
MIEIFGTLGPQCSDQKVLEDMFKEGMTGMRLNMSHAGLRESASIIHTYQEAAKSAGVKADLLIDMQGPELRTGKTERDVILNDGGSIQLKVDRPGHRRISSVPIPIHVMNALEIGDHVLFDDGKLEVEVKEIANNIASCHVIRGGKLSSKKSVKIVDKSIHGPALTAQDEENIAIAKDFGVTAIMQPFVQSAKELQEVKAVLEANDATDIRIFAKIESREGIAHLEEILPETDMVVIARGDLGNDMPLWDLPAAQKYIEKVCLAYQKPFLVVTQMLDSMVNRAVPTRAEVSDIFNAVEDGADAVMVTNETAVGRYPIDVIRYLYKTCQSAENYLKK